MNVSTLYRSPVALAVALAMSAAACPALALTAKAPAAKETAAAKVSQEDRSLMKLSQDGFTAMRSVHAARIAIFEGNPKRANELLGTAQSSLQAASKEAPVFVVDVKTGMNGKVVSDTTSVDKADLIPIDGQVTLADSFIDSPAKKSHIDKANEHLGKGRSTDAIDELKLAEVDASFSRVLMPLQATEKHVDEARKLIGESKFYEANLALKAVEDGLRFDSVTLSEAPKAKAVAKVNK